MKGADVTPEQIAHAEQFLKHTNAHCMGHIISIRREDLLRIMAWYAAVRVESGHGPHSLGPIQDTSKDTNG